MSADGHGAPPTAAPAPRGSVTRRILAGASVVAVATLAVKAIGFLKEVVVAATFGRGDAVEAFLIAMVLPTMVAGIVAGSFHQAFVPAYVRVRGASAVRDADRLALHAMLAAVVVLVVAAVALFVAAPAVVAVLASGYAPEKAALAVTLVRSLAPLCLLAGLPTMLAGILEAEERFAPVVLAQAGVPAVTLAWVLAVGSRLGPWPLVLGTLVGLAAQVGLLVLALGRGGHRIPALGGSRHREVGAVVAQWWPAAGAMVFQDLTVMVDQAMAARLEAGSVAALSYAYRIVSLPLTLLSSSLALAILPVLSDLAGRDDRTAFWSTAARWIRGTLWLGVPAVLAFAAVARPAVRLIYERGAFTEADTTVVSAVLLAYVGMVPFYVAGILAVQAVTALSMNRVLLWIGAVNLGVNIVGNLVLSAWIGVSGIAASTVIVYMISFALLLAALRSRRRDLGRAVGPD